MAVVSAARGCTPFSPTTLQNEKHCTCNTKKIKTMGAQMHRHTLITIAENSTVNANLMVQSIFYWNSTKVSTERIHWLRTNNIQGYWG